MLDQVLDSPLNLGVEALLILSILIVLETVLSADNAIALAALSQGIEDSKLQHRALNFGIIAAFVLRVCLILTATWVTKFWQFELLGAAYLLWLAWQYFTSDESNGHEHHGPRFTSIWQAIPMIALTDLAFSLDSVTTAIAVSDDTWLVLTGGAIGIITLRFLAELFIRWLDEFVYLQDAGYLTVALVGLRLLLRVFIPGLVPPQWLMILSITLIFVWGFSKHKPTVSAEKKTTQVISDEPESF